MVMKILNRFIDDCVNAFQYRFMDTFQYFKERNKNKYLGDRFEEWVVKNSNISKDGYRPLSSSSPDLLLECAVDRSAIYEVGEIIAVECKWRSKAGFYLERKDIEKYEVYMNINQLNRPIKSLFYVFGFGWLNDAPEQVYVVPARELYDYDKDTGQITFPAKESESERLERLKRFKKKDNKCLMYIE